MHDLFIFIPETSLREAVLEQVQAAKIGHVHLTDSFASLSKDVNDADDCVILIDESAFDKKASLWARDIIQKRLHATVLLLGDSLEAEHARETFAKPFRLGHLMTRTRYYLETAPLLRDRTVTFGPYHLEVHNRRILLSDLPETIKLTEKETALLVFLADRSTPATRQDILAAIWGYDERIDTHTLETHMYQLRRKLDKDSENWLVFEAGAYRLARPST